MKKTFVALLGAVMALAMTIQPASAAMNTVEHSSASKVNAERSKASRPRVRPQECLQRHAEAHARRMASAHRMYHQSSTQLRSIMRTCKLTAIGENIARGASMNSTQVVAAWMRSSGHRANILDRRYNKIAAAYRTGSGTQRYWIQLYGRA